MKDLLMRRPVDPEVLKLMLTALPNVAFDGWSNSTFVAACREADISELTFQLEQMKVGEKQESDKGTMASLKSSAAAAASTVSSTG